MFSFRPLTARLAGKLRPTRRFDWDGYPSQIIYPATTLERSRSIADEADYGRILGTIDGCDLGDWIAEARGGPQLQRPTRRFDLGPAMVANGSIYYRGGFESLIKGLPPLIARGPAERLGEVQMASFGLTEEFFGHWLIDGSLLLLLAERMGVTALTPRTPGMSGWSHRPGYVAMVDSPSVSPEYAAIERLWGVDDLGRNPQRASRLRELRRRVRSAAGRGNGARRVFVRRGLAGVRRYLRNEDDVCEVLESRYGFTIINPLDIAPSSLVSALRDAEIVMSVEGSQTFHGLVAACDGATIFQIMPATRFCIASKWFTDMVDMQFGFTVADAVEDGFDLPLDRLHKSVDLIARHR